MRRLFLAMTFAGCSPGPGPRTALPAEETELAAVTPPSSSPAPAPVPPSSERGLACVDGYPQPKMDRGLRVSGVPNDLADPRAPWLAEGACAVFPALFACRTEALKKGSADGTLEVTLSIDAKGAVTSAKRTEGSVAAGALSQCVEKAFSTAKFGAGAKGESKYGLLIHPRDTVVTMTETGTDIRGRLHPDEIKKRLRAEFASLRKCYEAVLKKNPDAFGTARFEFIINEQGAVTGAKVALDETINEPAVESCLLSVANALVFPPPELGKVLVVYPLRFMSGD